MRIIEPRTVTRGDGSSITLGLCVMCGRKLGLASSNKTGARCRYEGAQYSTGGELLWDAAWSVVKSSPNRAT
jgi:hypothetical protein